jgi:hypothetical protein
MYIKEVTYIIQLIIIIIIIITIHYSFKKKYLSRTEALFLDREYIIINRASIGTLSVYFGRGTFSFDREYIIINRPSIGTLRVYFGRGTFFK